MNGAIKCVPYKDRTKQKEAQQRSYIRKKDEILARQKARRPELNERNNAERQSRRDHVNSLKEKTPCQDCGTSYPYYVMEYDHVRGDKVGGIARMVSSGASLELILLEIAKCDLVCANCHRLRTHG